MADLHEKMRDLSQQLAALRAKLGEVSSEYAELNSVMAPFAARFRREVLRYHDALLAVQREIADMKALKGDHIARDAGEVASPLSRFFEDYASVQEQYDRVWGGKEGPSFSGPDLPPASPELKQYYAEVVAKNHPDLADSPAERERRSSTMQKADEAFVRRDEVTLQGMAGLHRERSNLPAIVDERVVKHLRDETHALETLIGKLEGQVFELRYGVFAKIKAYADLAQAEGQDLLQQLNREVRRDLQQAQQELSALKASR
jgi:hypothetical protein